MSAMRARSALIGALSGIALLLALPAQAQHGGGCSCGHNQNLHPTWEMDGFFPDEIPSITQSFDRWHRYVNTFAWVVGDNYVSGTNGKNEIMFIDSDQIWSIYGYDLGPDDYGVTHIRPASAYGSFDECPRPPGVTCGSFAETDVLLNLDLGIGWSIDPPLFSNAGPAYIPALAIHFLGIALGEHHNFDNLATMNYLKDIGGQYVFVADAAAARANYPTRVVSVADAATFPFRFVDGTGPDYGQPTTVTFSPASVTAGGIFEIRDVTLEIPGRQNLSNTTLRFYLSTDRTITPADIDLGGAVFASAPSGAWWDTTGWPVTVPSGTAPGNYYVGAIVFYNGTAQDAVTYNNSWATEQRITVSPPVPPGACVPSSTKLCLNQSRYHVTVDWRDYQGGTGTGTAIPMTTDSGLFWFFNASNIEFLVKVLDGCTVNNRVWVFAAATTDVEYTLRVQDSVTGQLETYFNPLGTASPAITDTGAFTTCGTLAPEGAPAITAADGLALVPLAGTTQAQVAALESRLEEASGGSAAAAGGVVIANESPIDALLGEPANPLACTPSSTTLCLNQSRFQVGVTWRDYQGRTGSGTAVPYTSDSGMFWFFNSSNIEFLVKVLNGCSINNRYWAFAAATTDVQYTLTVTDTLTGLTKSYTNPLGNASPAITDTTAFATCP